MLDEIIWNQKMLCFYMYSIWSSNLDQSYWNFEELCPENIFADNGKIIFFTITSKSILKPVTYLSLQMNIWLIIILLSIRYNENYNFFVVQVVHITLALDNSDELQFFYNLENDQTNFRHNTWSEPGADLIVVASVFIQCLYS